ENATKHLVEVTPSGSGIFFRGGAPAQSVPTGLDETASFNVLDDAEFAPAQIESPSQISQGTVSVLSETEDTLAGVIAPRRSGTVRPISPAPESKRWPTIVVVGVIVAAAVAAVAGI